MIFITSAYILSLLGCGFLVLATALQLKNLRKKLKQLSDDTRI